MIVDARSMRGTLTDLDAGRPVRWAFWADTEAGEYLAYRCDPKAAKALGCPLSRVAYRGRARLAWVPAPTPPAAGPGDVQPLAEARREVLRGRTVRPVIVLPGCPSPECDERLCHRPGAWVVCDEQEVGPEPGPGGAPCERAVATRYRTYCSWHYRAPTIVSLRGVESEHQVEARPR